jgi:hypothetical protein
VSANAQLVDALREEVDVFETDELQSQLDAGHNLIIREQVGHFVETRRMGVPNQAVPQKDTKKFCTDRALHRGRVWGDWPRIGKGLTIPTSSCSVRRQSALAFERSKVSYR